MARELGAGSGTEPSGPLGRVLVEYRSLARRTSVPVGLSERLWARVRPDRTAGLRRARLLPLWSRWAAVAAVVILVGLALWLGKRQTAVLVAAAGEEIVTASLPDGSLVTLRPHSSLSRMSPGNYRLAGEAVFDILPDPERAIRVRTDLGEVRVLGTRFNLSSWGGQTRLFLERGKVAFLHLGTGAVDTLLPGHEVVADTRGLTRQDTPSLGDSALDWTESSLVFQNRSLALLVAELEHHYAIRVQIPDSLESVTLSGRVLLLSEHQSLRDLGMALGARFEEGPPHEFRLRLD